MSIPKSPGAGGRRKDLVWYTQGGDPERKAHRTWYRGENTNFIASKSNLLEENGIEQYVLKGWLPDKPFLDKMQVVTAFGSCFAAHITRHLGEKGYNLSGKDLTNNAHIIRCGEGIVNTFAIRQQFEWAFENKQFIEDLWFGKDGEVAKPNDMLQEVTKAIFSSTDVFIITLGLSEVWYNKVSGEVFWRAIPAQQFNHDEHSFRVSSVAENVENLEDIYRAVSTHRPDAKLVFTLSPVPLVATFRPVSCISANEVSKATLRVAVDELMRNHQDAKNLFYFPSYELVRDVFDDPYAEDNRHIKRPVVEKVMQIFEKHYCVG